MTNVVPRYQVTIGFGLALHLHLIVISVPVSFGIIFGFSTKDGANPAASSPPKTKQKGQSFFYSFIIIWCVNKRSM